MPSLIIYYTGIARRAAVEVAGDAENMKIVLEKDDGTTETLYTGQDFSEEKLKAIISQPHCCGYSAV